MCSAVACFPHTLWYTHRIAQNPQDAILYKERGEDISQAPIFRRAHRDWLETPAAWAATGQSQPSPSQPQSRAACGSEHWARRARRRRRRPYYGITVALPVTAAAAPACHARAAATVGRTRTVTVRRSDTLAQCHGVRSQSKLLLKELYCSAASAAAGGRGGRGRFRVGSVLNPSRLTGRPGLGDAASGTSGLRIWKVALL